MTGIGRTIRRLRVESCLLPSFVAPGLFPEDYSRQSAPKSEIARTPGPLHRHCFSVGRVPVDVDSIPALDHFGLYLLVGAQTHCEEPLQPEGKQGISYSAPNAKG